MTLGKSAGGYLAGLATVSCNAQAPESAEAIKTFAPNPISDPARFRASWITVRE